jgi:hypothetical protein
MFTKPGKLLFNNDWRFMTKELNSLFPELDDSENNDWRDTELPHDWTVGGSHEPCDGWYKKEFMLTEEELEQSIELTFDGIHADCAVYVNETFAAEYKHGYTGFSLEIGHLVREGSNTVHVRVQPGSVKMGAGIYRNVYLTKQHKTHIVTDGVYIISRVKVSTWKTRVHVEYTGDVDAIRYAVYNPSGELVAAEESSGDYIFEFNEPEIWSVEKPQLYSLKTQLICGDRITDEVSTVFGFRTIGFTESDGLILNERRVKLKGVGLRNDSGALNFHAVRRQLVSLKMLGVNAVRTDCNPPSPEMIRLCDELGLLVIDEFTGEYEPRDTAYRVRRNRNHPCAALRTVTALSDESFAEIDRCDPYLNSAIVTDRGEYEEHLSCFPAYDSLFNSAELPKPAYYFYKAIWGSADSEPFVKIFPHWDWNPGQLADISVYSNVEKIELFFNGESLGRQIIDLFTDDVQCASWRLPYERGELVARAYDSDDDITAVGRIASFWDASVLKADYSDEPLRANGRDLKYIAIYAYDENSENPEGGEFVANANNRVTVEVSGAARLVSFDNGDPCDHDSVKSDNRRLYGGRAMAVIQTSLEPGKAHAEISSSGLKEVLLEFDVLPADESERIGVSTVESERTEQNSRDEIPVRKIELTADRTELDTNNCIARVKAEVFPENADYTDIEWSCVSDDDDDDDEDTPVAEISGGATWCQVTGKKPGSFRVCACCKDAKETAQVVSEIEMIMKGNADDTRPE